MSYFQVISSPRAIMLWCVGGRAALRLPKYRLKKRNSLRRLNRRLFCKKLKGCKTALRMNGRPRPSDGDCCKWNTTFDCCCIGLFFLLHQPIDPNSDHLHVSKMCVYVTTTSCRKFDQMPPNRASHTTAAHLPCCCVMRQFR